MKKRNTDLSRKWTEKGLSEQEPERRMHYLDIALELDPDNPAALNNKGMLLHKRGKFHEAIECYDRILVRCHISDPVPALYNKALALKALRRDEAALTFMKRAIKQKPDSERIKKHVTDLTHLTRDRSEIKSNTTGHTYIPPEDMAVNQVYTRWDPPDVNTLLALALKCSNDEIKYYKGFGEDLIKEKTIIDKLATGQYSCRTCHFYKKDICYHIDTKSMAVMHNAICRRFRPAKQRAQKSN